MSLAKRTFYPDPEIEEHLSKAPPKKLSYYINTLIHKGLDAEEKTKIAESYRHYDEALSQERSFSHQDRVNDRILVDSLFAEEDEAPDWY